MQGLQVKLFHAQSTQQKGCELRSWNECGIESAGKLRARDEQRYMRILITHAAVASEPVSSPKDIWLRLQNNVRHSRIFLRSIERKRQRRASNDLLDAEALSMLAERLGDVFCLRFIAQPHHRDISSAKMGVDAGFYRRGDGIQFVELNDFELTAIHGSLSVC